MSSLPSSRVVRILSGLAAALERRPGWFVWPQLALFVASVLGTVLGLRFETGFIVPTRENEDIPVNERFFTGGESSVRSFEEDQVGPKGEGGDPLGGLA
ncbi:MAG: BamA/TamA family outer membrane protein, partial [Verrucomicrobiota bacterium]